MWIGDFKATIEANTILDRQVLDLLSDNSIDWDGPITLNECLVDMLGDIRKNGVSRQDVTRLQSFKGIENLTKTLNPEDFSGERTFSGVTQTLMVIRAAIKLVGEYK